jgi:hypothetical protein
MCFYADFQNKISSVEKENPADYGLSFPCCRDDILIFFEVKNLLDAEDT